MSLLTIAQSVCDEIGITRPTAIAGSTDQLSRQILALANLSLRELAKKDWPELITDYSFNTAVGTSQYALPADFKSLISNTLYNSAAYYQVKGSISPQNWMRDKNVLLGTVGRAEFRLYGTPSKINIVPTPTAIEALVFEYLSSSPAANSGGAAQAAYVADTDVSRIDEDLVQLALKWRLLRAKGLDYGEDKDIYDGAVKLAFATKLTPPTLGIGERLLGGDPITQGYIRETGFGA